MVNADALDAWLRDATLTARAAAVAALCRTLAERMDGDDWTAQVADVYRKSLGELVLVLAEEGDDDSAGTLLELVSRAEVRDGTDA